MKANELIEKQHRLVEDLFEQFERAKGAAKRRIFERIAGNLVAHDAIEREIFYPACEEALTDEDILGEALVEHGVVEFCIFRADKNQGHDEFDKYVTVLKEVVMHHVKEEEKELLPKAKRALGKEQLEELGAEMEARFEQALRGDFRAPLRDALEQVLAGKTKTTPKRQPRRSSANHGSTNRVHNRREAAEQPRVRRRRRK